MALSYQSPLLQGHPEEYLKGLIDKHKAYWGYTQYWPSCYQTLFRVKLHRQGINLDNWMNMRNIETEFQKSVRSQTEFGNEIDLLW